MLPSFLSFFFFFFSTYGTSAKALVIDVDIRGGRSRCGEGVEQAGLPRTNNTGFQLGDAPWMGDLCPVRKKPRRP